MLTFTVAWVFLTLSSFVLNFSNNGKRKWILAVSAICVICSIFCFLEVKDDHSCFSYVQVQDIGKL